MRYKASCPTCGKKVSRWFIFFEPTIYHRCRGCGLRHRMGLAGWIMTFVVIALALLWFALFRMHIVSAYFAITLLLTTLALTVWLFPYLCSVQAERRPDTSS